MSKTKEELNKMSIKDLETHLDETEKTEPREYRKGVMAVRNQKIRQEQLDHWCLSEEEYAAALHECEEKNRLEGEVHEAQTQLKRAEAALQISIDKKEADSDHAEEVNTWKDTLEIREKALKEHKPKTKLQYLQAAQRKAMKSLRETQMVKAVPANIGITGH